MLLLIYIGCATTLFSLIFLTANMLMGQRLVIQERLDKYVAGREKKKSKLEGSLYDRLIAPMLQNTNGFIHRVTPKHYYVQLEKKLKEAGGPANIHVGTLIFIQMSILLVEILGIFIIWLTYGIPFTKALLAAAALAGITYIFPKLYLKQKIELRQKEIEKTLPDVLDLLTVSIEAGLSFDGAMAKLTEKMSGVLVQEFAIVLKEMRVGKSKREALKSLIDRVPVPDLITFIGAILQADQLGVSIGNVLRIQSAQMRQKRRQRAQEAAMKAPIKMLFPMIFFILPTIFIVLLGPVIIKVIELFS